MPTFPQHVKSSAPNMVAQELDKMSEFDLAKANIDEVVEQFFDRTRVDTIDIDFDELRNSVEYDVVNRDTNEVRIYIRHERLREFGPILSFQPSTGKGLSLHIDGNEISFVSSPKNALSDLESAIGILRTLNKDVESSLAELRQHIRVVAEDRIGRARTSQAAKNRDLKALESEGIRRRVPLAEVADNPQFSAPRISVRLFAIADESIRDAMLTMLDELERRLNVLDDIDELSEEGKLILSRDAVPLIKALRAILNSAVATEEERKVLVRRGLVDAGRAKQAIISAGQFVSGIYGLGRIPEIVENSVEKIDHVISAIF